MIKICWANTTNFDDSRLVVLGIPDESLSHSLRKGTSQAPDIVRQISNIRDSYTRNGNKTLGLPISGIQNKVYDYGNISRTEINNVYKKILQKSKIPILIGGDHSITTEVVKSLRKKFNKISVVYFDAHPDFVSSTTSYYGSVFFDILSHIDPETSLQIGIRTPEQEELENLRKYNVSYITPYDIIKKGVKNIEKIILDKLGKDVYISFDMDCIDPSYAPGVSVPVPLGLHSVDALYLLRSIVKKGIIGLDIMEVCPEYDIKDRTSHLASRLIGEVISSCNE